MVFWEAFGLKLHPIMGRRERAIPVLASAFEADRAIVALRAGTVVGLLGLQHGGRDFVNLRRRHFAQEFGWLRAIPKAFLASFAQQPDSKGELFLVSLAVAPAWRNRGLGGKLLGAAIQFARDTGFKTVALDVVDTNPRARLLYERLGFKATKTHHYPFLRPLMGFSSVTTMTKAID
jgi:ribosomal protein S18 acetylase RimI-like enzyme